MSVLLLLLFQSCMRAQSVPNTRSVSDLEYGQYYGYAPSASVAGLEVLQPHDRFFQSMNSDAIKAPHGHFQHFAPKDPGDDFPYAALKDFEAKEITAGRPPIFVTATYEGVSSPVYFEWHLALDRSGNPTAPNEQWSQLVNLRDDRFIRFYVNAYLRSTLWKPLLQRMWHAVDNCSFRYNNYGVLDSNGHYQNNIVWDQGFPQSDSEFLDAIKYFLKRVKEIAPDVHIIGNEGSMNDESRFSDVWSGFDGTIREDITNSFAGDKYSRAQMKLFFDRYQFEGSAGKAAVLRALISSPTSSDAATQLRTSYLAYLIFRGPNFFFAPRYDDGTVQGVPPSLYADMAAALGLPSAAASSISSSGGADRLYIRQTEGGIVYLNWTGTTQTVSLPAGRNYYDRSGKQVHTLAIADLHGDYVVVQPGTRSGRPLISPRIAGPISGPVTVSLTAKTGATIHYTLDGSKPTSASPVYTGPLSLSRNATVSAMSSCHGCLDSFANSQVYSVSAALPTTSFQQPAGVSDGFGFPDYVLVQLSHASATTITVAYSPTGGTAFGSKDIQGLRGSVSFAPGEVVKAIPLSVQPTDSAGKTVMLSLGNLKNSILGSQSSFSYTIANGQTQ